MLNNLSLENFVKELELDEQNKAKILSKIPSLDEEERVNLLEALVDIYFLREQKEKTKKFLAVWREFIQNPDKGNLEKIGFPLLDE